MSPPLSLPFPIEAKNYKKGVFKKFAVASSQTPVAISRESVVRVDLCDHVMCMSISPPIHALVEWLQPISVG